jgi:O-antigen/teichoic acid export membrane protein
MFGIFNHFALFLISIFGIVVLDDDPRGVSMQEWIFFAVMIYAAVSIFRGFQEYLRNGGG